MTIRSTKKLNTGADMPVLGYGTYRLPDGPEAVDCILRAIEAGYRHIDTAALYGNERSVGKAVRESGIPRSEFFITTKLWNDDMRSRRQREAFAKSMDLLGLDYVDLYLSHWPVRDFYVETWLVLEELLAGGRVKAIGVSNHTVRQLEELFRAGTVVPAVNQVELHPHFPQNELVDFCVKQGIAVTAWSPLGGKDADLRDNPVLQKIAAAHGKTTSQVMLRWGIQRSLITIPKSSNPARIVENADIFDFELSSDDMGKIATLDNGMRGGADPENFSF